MTATRWRLLLGANEVHTLYISKSLILFKATSFVIRVPRCLTSCLLGTIHCKRCVHRVTRASPLAPRNLLSIAFKCNKRWTLSHQHMPYPFVYIKLSISHKDCIIKTYRKKAWDDGGAPSVKATSASLSYI